MTRNAPSTLAAVCSSATLGTLDAELWLEPHALKRWRRFRHRRDRDGFLVARVLTAILWGRLRGRDPDTCCFQQTCSECGGPHGRPRIVGETELWPSWSHSGDLVAAIVGPAPVAIDIETNTHAIPVDITGPGTAAERQERWSLAECWTKAGYTDLGSALDHIRRGTTPSHPALPPAQYLHRHYHAFQGLQESGPHQPSQAPGFASGWVVMLSRDPASHIEDIFPNP